MPPDLSDTPSPESNGQSPSGSGDPGGEGNSPSPDKGFPGLTLSGKQAKDLGIDDADDGDAVTVKLTGTISKGDGAEGMGGVTLNIMSGTRDEMGDENPPGAQDRIGRNTRTLSPKEAGMPY